MRNLFLLLAATVSLAGCSNDSTAPSDPYSITGNWRLEIGYSGAGR